MSMSSQTSCIGMVHMNGNFDGLKNEVSKLFADNDGKRRLMEDIAELREMLDKYFGFEEDEPCENEK